MNKLFNEPVLAKLFDSRNEELSEVVIKKSEEYNTLIDETKKKIKQLLLYVPGDMYENLESEIDNFLYNNVLSIAEFWNSRFYKIGFSDGLKVKKEVEQSLEGLQNG